MTSEAEHRFYRDMVVGIATLKREIGYNPTRFMQMVSEHGGVGAARALLAGRDASDGFTILWQHQRLAMSVEAFVLLPWYADLFTDAERETARNRMAAHGFDVDAYLREARERVPTWIENEES